MNSRPPQAQQTGSQFTPPVQAVQVNVVGRDGAVGRPMLLSTATQPRSTLPTNTASGSFQWSVIRPSNCVTAATQPSFRYCVKIMDPDKPSQYMTRQLHHFCGKFDCVTAIKVHLMDKLGECVPDTIHFNVGYFEGRQSKKRWLCCQEDLDAMYQQYKVGNELTLWCDAKKATPRGEEQSITRKRKQDGSSTKCQEKEEEVDNTFKDLKEKHGDKYDNPKLRLWARMIASGLHDSLDEHPAIPAFQGGEPKRRKGTIAEALTGAVETVMKYVDKQPPQPPSVVPSRNTDSVLHSGSHSSQIGISPGKAAELRMKNLEQLRYLQGLYEDKILSDEELTEQKRMILDALRQLS